MAALLALMRATDQVADTAVVAADLHGVGVSDMLVLRDSNLPSRPPRADALPGVEVHRMAGTLDMTASPIAAHILWPRSEDMVEHRQVRRIRWVAALHS